MTIDSGRWYSIASLSPNPELNERYAFGVVICDANRLKLEIARDISTSFRFLSTDQRQAFKILVSNVGQDLKHLDTFDAIVRTYGPQIVFSERHPILIPVTPTVISQLISGWFGIEKPAQSQQVEQASLAMHPVVEDMLRGMVPPFGVKLLPKASPKKLGYGLKDKTIRIDEAEIDYAISGTNRDLLLSIIDLKCLSEQVLSSKTIRSSRAFWFWSNNRIEFQRRSRKEFRTMGVVLNGIHDEKLKEWGRFIQHIWSQDCDKVLATHDEVLPKVLSSEMKWLLQDG